MKDDVLDLPPVPRTRRGLHRALDLHLAMWAADEALPDADRRRVQQERDRRKQGDPSPSLGVIVDQAGMTPEQRAWLRERLAGPQAPGAVHHGGAQGVHSACRQAGVASIRHDTQRRTAQDTDLAIVRLAATVVVFPASRTAPPQEPRGPWGMARYARHRSLPTTVVLPDGQPTTTTERGRPEDA